MHEGNFTQQIVEAILDALKPCARQKPKQVRVRVGEMLHLVPDSVQMHYQVLTRNTVLEGVELLLEEEPVRITCRSCGKSGGVEDHHLLLCGSCGSREVDLTAGEDVIIDEIELESSP